MATGTWALGWATSDVVSAAEYAKSMGSIYDTTLGAGAASIDITGIVASYAHLMIVAYLRSDTAATGCDIVVRFNGDSGANYTVGASTTQTSVNGAGANTIIPAASTAASIFSSTRVLIPHYAGTANFKSANGESSFANVSQALGGTWRNTAAINRVTVSAAAGNILTGSRLTIYALGA